MRKAQILGVVANNKVAKIRGKILDTVSKKKKAKTGTNNKHIHYLLYQMLLAAFGKKHHTTAFLAQHGS
jgi:hypothetical protein